MRKFLVFGLLAACSLMLVGGIFAESQIDMENAAPTLVPPTPIPQPNPLAEEDLPPTSAVARIAESGKVNVGILYNEPPFSELNVRGFVSGFDADLANSMASAWEVDTNFVQVPRDPQVIARMLRRGEIDMVIAALVRDREADAYIEFSQTYHVGKKGVMVMADDPAETLSDLAGRRIGVVIATPAEQALATWQARSGISIEVEQFFTLDQAYRALINGEIGGVVDSEHRLERVVGPALDAIRILTEPIQVEPYAIGFLRQDSAMRDLINRTLHHLTAIRRMNEIQQVHFPGDPYRIRVWNNLPEDAPNLSDYPVDLNYPSQYVLPRVQGGGTIRVAGIFGAGSDSPESERRLDAFHRRLIDEMASRWGARVEYINVTGADALELVANGGADIAVGVEPDWAWANRVDFTNFYLLHGERMMIRADSGIVGMTSLRGRAVLVPSNEPNVSEWLLQIARTVNVTLEAVPQREQDLAFLLLGGDEDITASAVFGNSLKLIPHVQANENLILTNVIDNPDLSRWYGPSNLPGDDYSPRMMVMALPENDIDFRLLVEYTLQEIAREGRLNEWLEPLMLPRDIPTFEIWPGIGTHIGFNLLR